MPDIQTIGNLVGMDRQVGSVSGSGADAIHQSIHDALKAAVDALEAADTALTGATLILTGDAIIGGDAELDGALNHDGSTAGFYGATPTVQLTGVAVTAAGIHAALVTLGLITA